MTNNPNDKYQLNTIKILVKIINYFDFFIDEKYDAMLFVCKITSF